MRLIGRRILITGAASGIGRETAMLFAREGASVGLLDCQGDQLEQSVAAVRAAGKQAAWAVADVTEEAPVMQGVASIAKALGGLDGIVNAAGMDLLRLLADMTSAEWNRVLAVNLTGPYQVCRAALPVLREAGKGTVVNIASAAALRPLENRTAYCAAKAGLVMFSKALAIEWAAYGIRVNAICPGIVDTPMFRASYEKAADPEAEFQKILDRYVIRRVGQPADIANAALYLSSDESSYVTGSALAVDGGRSFH